MSIPIDFDPFLAPAPADVFPIETTIAPTVSAAIEVLPAEPATEEDRVAQQALALVARAKAFQVTDPTSYELAGRMIDELKTKRKDVVGWFAPMVDAAHTAWKALTSKRASVTDPLDEALTVLSSRYATFAREERQRADEQRRRDEQAAQAREQERLRQEAAEAQRLAEEAAAAALSAQTREEAQALEQQAEQLTQQADEARVEAATLPAPVLPTQSRIDHCKGPAVAQNWQHEVTDFEALIKAVADKDVSMQALLANDTYLRQRAKADKATCRIPGVRVYDAGSVRASRSRR